MCISYINLRTSLMNKTPKSIKGVKSKHSKHFLEMFYSNPRFNTYDSKALSGISERKISDSVDMSKERKSNKRQPIKLWNYLLTLINANISEVSTINNKFKHFKFSFLYRVNLKYNLKTYTCETPVFNELIISASFYRRNKWVAELILVLRRDGASTQ